MIARWRIAAGLAVPAVAGSSGPGLERPAVTDLDEFFVFHSGTVPEIDDLLVMPVHCKRRRGPVLLVHDVGISAVGQALHAIQHDKSDA